MSAPNRLTGVGRMAGQIIVLLIASLLVAAPASSKTTVTKTGPCEVTITVKMEIWGPNASQAVADRWKRNIESRWNGPTYDQIREAANRDIKSTDRRNSTNRAKLENRVNEFKPDSSCAIVNCCKICTVVDIRVRGDEATAGYHQIKVVPNYRTEINEDGAEVRVRNRSFVMTNHGMMGGGQQHSTTGEWRDDATINGPESHEVGHLMAIGDQYAGGTRTNLTRLDAMTPGHAHDLMNTNSGWPHASVFTEILGIRGVTCNCCQAADSFFVAYGRTVRPAGDAIAACNVDVMQQALQDFKDQRENMRLASGLPVTRKLELGRQIDDWIKRLQKAIEDCKKRRPVTGVGLTDGIITGGSVSTDSSVYCEYWGTDTPLTPTAPPETPTAPPETPTAPPETPTAPPTGPPTTVTPPEAPTVTPPAIVSTPKFPTGREDPTPSTTPPKKPKPPSTPPPTTYKVSRAVLNAAGQAVLSAMPGARVKVNLFAVPSLPVAGTKKPVAATDDREDHGDPITGHTNKKGELTLGKGNQSAQMEQPVPMLAAGSIVSDIQPLVVAEAMRLARAQESPRVVEIVIPKFKSYIVKLKLNRSLKQWDDPGTYLKDQDLKSYIMRHWIVRDTMYVVFNFPVVEEK